MWQLLQHKNKNKKQKTKSLVQVLVMPHANMNSVRKCEKDKPHLAIC